MRESRPSPALEIRAPSTVSVAPIHMGAWSFYFLAKFVLYGYGLIDFHALENLAFAAVLLAPLSPAWRRARHAVALPVALALLYYDSWLPPFERLWSQAALLTDFSADYLLELAGRFINWQVIALLVLAWAAHRIVARYIRVGALVAAVLVALTVAPLFQQKAVPALAGNTADTATSDPETMLRDFYAAEAQRSVRLPTMSPAAHAPFDLVFLHVCSLSWDDLQASGLNLHPLWSRFDVLFTHFNSVASYSGPAAIRINRALCGQTTHKGLYDSVPDNCYLLPSLQRAGFTPELAMNHDGHFDDFLPLLRRQGVNAPLMPLEGTPIPQRGFDNSPIHEDLAVLTRWLDQRKQAKPGDANATRVALYYNTISLHDGNKLSSGVRLDTAASYRQRAGKLFDDINAFIQLLEQSGRRAIVVVVPEHGAALRGDKFQVSGLREIPSPRITTVPVGVKIIGAQRQDDTARISEPTSYLGLSQLVANLMERSPYETPRSPNGPGGPGAPSGYSIASYTAQLPTTRHVASNGDITVMGANGRYFMQQGTQAWKDYAQDAP